MKKLPLSKGKVAIVSDADYPKLSRFKWSYHHSGVAARKDGDRYVYLHRAIMRAKPGIQIDHINRNPLDNRRENLRPATPGENTRNRGRQRNNRSGCVGVSFDPDRDRWRATVVTEGRQEHVGYFKRAGDACDARDLIAARRHGAFANLDHRVSKAPKKRR